MDAHELQTAIVELVNRPNYQPVKPRILAKKLGLPKEKATEVRRAVKRLVRQGLVSYASNHIVRPAEAKPALPGPQPEGERSSTPAAQAEPDQRNCDMTFKRTALVLILGATTLGAMTATAASARCPAISA